MNLTDLQLFSATGGDVLNSPAWNPGGVRGADKVATRFIYALLTPAGSAPGRPNDGSDFVNLVQGFRSEFDVFSAFAAAQTSAVATVQAAQVSTEDASEMFGSVTITNVTIVSGMLTITLAVTALDGSSPSQPVVFNISL